MTQPPQQPGQWGGQPGYGGQPGPGQQPGGYPQQGGYPPQGGQPQQGGFPPGGPQPQQAGGFGQPGQFGQQGPYGQPGGYGYGPQKKSKLPWILAGGGVIAIAVVVVLVLALGGGGSGSPQGVAEDVVDAFNAKDADKLNELACESAKEQAGTVKPSDLEPPEGAEGIQVKAELGEVKENGSTATADMTISLSGGAADKLPGGVGDTKLTMELADEDGWCVKDIG